MKTILDKDLRDIAQMMTYCCGPFARSPEDVKSLAQELLQVAIKLQNTERKDARLIHFLQRLSGGATVADKRASIDEHKTLIKKWKELL
jgi:hypothetical protein